MQEHPTVGVIGIGNMSRAIVGGMVDQGWNLEEVVIHDISSEAIEHAKETIGSSLHVASDIEELHERSDVIMVGVNPFQIKDALTPLNDQAIRLISIAVSVRIDDLRKWVGRDSEIIRVMPNTPAQVRRGMTFITPGSRVEDDFLATTEAMFKAVGSTRIIEEDMMDAGAAIAGSGPAYFFYFLEAMQYAGIYVGFDEDAALEIAIQTLLGSAELAVQSEATPGQLQQEVASPRGTTIEALKHLDETGTAGHIQEAINQHWQKAKRMH